MTIKIKEYNQWELRFLEILIPNNKFIRILSHCVGCTVDRMIWRGSILLTDGKEWTKGLITDDHLPHAEHEFTSINKMIEGLR